MTGNIYIDNVWIMNDAGAIREAVTREIVVENGQITGYRRCCAG